MRKEYEIWHKTIKSIPESELLSSVWYQAVRKRLLKRNGLTLEVACGCGAYARERAKSGEKIIAVDFSITALMEAKTRSKNFKIRYPIYVAADAHCLPFKNNTFDTIISCETYEHLEKPRIFLYEIHRLLKHDGILCITFPSYLNLLGLYRIYLSLRKKEFSSGAGNQPRENAPLWPFVLIEMLLKGFRLISFFGQVHLIPLPRRPIIWLKKIDAIPVLQRFLSPFALHILFLLRKN